MNTLMARIYVNAETFMPSGAGTWEEEQQEVYGYAIALVDLDKALIRAIEIAEYYNERPEVYIYNVQENGKLDLSNPAKIYFA